MALGHSQLPTFCCSVPSDVPRHLAPNPISLAEPPNPRYGTRRVSRTHSSSSPSTELRPLPEWGGMGCQGQLLSHPWGTPKGVHKLTAPLVSPPAPPHLKGPTISPAGFGISAPHVPARSGCRLSPIPREGVPRLPQRPHLALAAGAARGRALHFAVLQRVIGDV